MSENIQFCLMKVQMVPEGYCCPKAINCIFSKVDTNIGDVCPLPSDKANNHCIRHIIQRYRFQTSCSLPLEYLYDIDWKNMSQEIIWQIR